MWVLSWYGDAIRAGQSISTYPLAFFPSGWRYSENLYMLLGMLPLHWLGGPAFAYNLVVLLSFIAAFIGAYLLARQFIDRFAATIAALLIAFWGGRWFHTLWTRQHLDRLCPRPLDSLDADPRLARRTAPHGLVGSHRSPVGAFHGWLIVFCSLGWRGRGDLDSRQSDGQSHYLAYRPDRAGRACGGCPGAQHAGNLLAMEQRRRKRRYLLHNWRSKLLGSQPEQPAHPVHRPSLARTAGAAHLSRHPV